MNVEALVLTPFAAAALPYIADASAVLLIIVCVMDLAQFEKEMGNVSHADNKA